MNRLVRSASGHIRGIQISRATLHIFVEGRDLDSYVYGKIARVECGGFFGYRITRGDQLPNSGGGGKSVLLDFFRKLRRAKALSGEFKGNTFTTIFFVDKDIDDLTHSQLRSRHLVYTSTYDIEGEVFASADIHDCVGAACYLDPEDVRTTLASDNWTLRACELWRDWVVICIVARLSESGVVGYASPSLVNPSYNAPADPIAVSDYRSKIMDASTIDSAAFNRLWTRTEGKVSRVYADGNPMRLFKGKWFKQILSAEIETLYPANFRRSKNLSDRLVGHAAQSAAADGAWAQKYRKAIHSLVSDM